MADIKTYRIKAGESHMTAISLVEDPAVESNFVALSKQTKQNFSTVEDGERRMVYGVALRADFPIYRRDYDGYEYNIVFEKEAVRRLSQKFMKEYRQKEWTLNHHWEHAEGLTLTESWLVEDVNLDKAKSLGLENVSKGSWCIGCLVDDGETWARIKDGDFKGFSIEAFCDLEEINLSRQETSMKSETLFEKIKNLIIEAFGKETPACEASGINPIEEETKQETVEAEAQETAEEQPACEASGSETPQNGTEEAVESQETEEVADTTAEEENEPQSEETANEEETVAEESETRIEASAEYQELLAENETLKGEIASLKATVEKYSKRPSAPTTETKKETKSMGLFASLRAQGIIQ